MYLNICVPKHVFNMYVDILPVYRWKAMSDPFNFDSDVNPGALADGMARERWTRDFFRRLQR